MTYAVDNRPTFAASRRARMNSCYADRGVIPKLSRSGERATSRSGLGRRRWRATGLVWGRLWT